MVALAEQHAVSFAQSAAAYDRDGAFPHQHVATMQASGLMRALVPSELGGGGVRSLHDLLVAISRLAEGDAGLTIGVSMHFLVTAIGSRAWYAALESGGSPDPSALQAVSRGELVYAVLNSEAGADNRHPFAEARREGDEWVINGRKAFATFSPAATTATVRIRVRDGDDWRMGSALIRLDQPGVVPQDNWDALGMRSSGSQDIVLEDVRVPAAAVVLNSRWGALGLAGHAGGALAAPILAAPFLGIAEAAHRYSAEQVAKRKRQPGDQPLREWTPVQMLAGENEVSLAAMRGALAHAIGRAEAAFDEHWPATPPEETLHQVMRAAQAAKYFVNHEAVRVVDRCLEIAGGGGYASRSPLSRHYRDVRAGPFMSPLGAVEALEYLGRVAFGLPPEG